MVANRMVTGAPASDFTLFGLDLLYPESAAPALSPLVCIAQNITVESGGGRQDVQAVFLSPAGDLVFTLYPTDGGSQVEGFISCVRSWSYEDLESIAAEFTYHSTGQAFRIIDLMAQHGHLAFSGASVLREAADRNLSSGKFCILAAAPVERGDAIE